MSKSYHSILVPYDGSTHSQKALKFAIDIANAFDSPIHLVNVLDVSAVSPPGKILSQGARKTLDQIKNSIRASTEAHLQKVQNDYKNSGAVIKKAVLDGDIVGKLLKFAQDNNIDMIIIGSRGRSGISKIMTLGSTSRRISEMASCPVVIVR